MCFLCARNFNGEFLLSCPSINDLMNEGVMCASMENTSSHTCMSTEFTLITLSVSRMSSRALRVYRDEISLEIIIALCFLQLRM